MSISIGVQDLGWSLYQNLHTTIGVFMCPSHLISLRSDLKSLGSVANSLSHLISAFASFYALSDLWIASILSDRCAPYRYEQDRPVNLGHLVVFLFVASDSRCLVLRTCVIQAEKFAIGLRDLGQMFQDRSSVSWDTCAFSRWEAKDIFPEKGVACLV